MPPYNIPASVRGFRAVLPVRYAVGGEILMELSVDFTHRVCDVENSIRYHTQKLSKVVSPKPRMSTDRILELCHLHQEFEIQVVVSANSSFLV